MWQVVLWGVVIVLVAVALFLLARDKYEGEMDKLRMYRLSHEALYLELKHIMRQYSKRRLEQVLVREDYVLLRYFRPLYKEIKYDYRQRGFQKLDNDKVHALMLLIAHDIQELDDKSRYYFTNESAYKPNGDKVKRYAFIIRPAYKDAVNRAYGQLPQVDELLEPKHIY